MQNNEAGQSKNTAIELIKKKIDLRKKDPKDTQIGFLALNKKGEYGSYALHKGFNYAVYDGTQGNRLEDAIHLL